MRNWLRRYTPDHAAVSENRWLYPFRNTLLHPRLWHINRHSAAGGVAVGLFCGLIPGPFQMIFAALCAVFFRINLPLALITTLYTNPLTVVPLYVVAFGLGRIVMGVFGHGNSEFIHPPEYGDVGAETLLAWIAALGDWVWQLGAPLAIGLPLLAAFLAIVGYLVVYVAWRIYLIRAWRHRARSRRVGQTPVA
ncbi:MAG: DUF2062 domain-containing protein [Rhodocyclaceae bacterium]|nr:DUF2062 domain-containing protein [Rhodocyclaceae bacterium]